MDPLVKGDIRGIFKSLPYSLPWGYTGLCTFGGGRMQLQGRPRFFILSLSEKGD